MVLAWVKELVEAETGGAPFQIGDVVKHPSGRMVKIIAGRYWGEHGVSNWWEWQEIMPEGSKVVPPLEKGYGWEPT